jgi:tripartite ATP-independent transporter DctM subunit
LVGAEDAAAATALLLLALLPVVEMLLRTVFRTGILGHTEYISHLVLVLGYFGGIIAARKGRHLSLTGGYGGARTRLSRSVVNGTTWLAVVVTTALGWSAISLVLVGFDPSRQIGIIPVRAVVAVIPLGYAGMALHFAGRFRGRLGIRWALGGTAVLLGTVLAYGSLADTLLVLLPAIPEWVDALWTVWYRFVPAVALPGVVLLVVSAFAGTPLFVVLSGATLLLFARSAGALAVVPNEGYNMLTGSNIPAIPLFTFVGYILSESRAGERLVRLFRALLGWLPGGLAVAAVLTTAFFTAFTGASGVTILAVGGLLYFVLHTRGTHTQSFTVGFLTSSANIGLLFPPSLAVILYGTVAGVNILHLFLAGLVPGLLLVLAFSVVGMIASVRRGVGRTPASVREIGAALREAMGEVLLPVVILAAYFGGLTTLVETAALAVLYVLVIEVLVKGEIPVRRITRIALRSAVIAGGVLVILAAARALSFYIVDAQVPMMLRDWVETTISSRLVFLILLNVALLVTGCLMDIFSAILIVAPLVIPLGALFGVAPVHLGVIFLANLGLGFITPPVGLDLFLASYRFARPLPKIYLHIAPFFLLELAIVLIITYIPPLSTIVPALFGR